MGQVSPHVRDGILAHLRSTHPSMCRRWFDDIVPLDLSGGTLKLLVKEAVQLKYLKRNCRKEFTEAIQAVLGMLVAVRFVGQREADALRRQRRATTSPDGRPSAQPEPPAGTMEPSGDLDEGIVISPDHSFENFLVGPSNRLAHAAAVAVANKPACAYNPLFVHGGVGLGKTHLLQAICQAALRNQPDLTIHYTCCNDFVNQFHDAVQAGKMKSFRHRFRSVDMLLIDDIHDLRHRERTQEEFFHSFNSLTQAGKQIVLSSDAAPDEIPDLEERLSSRFNCGLVAEIQKPDFESRVAIVKNKAALRGIAMADDVASFLASKINTNIRDLEGAITKMQGLAVAHNVALDLQLAKRAVGDHQADIHPPTIQEIVDTVTTYYGVKLSDLLSRRRHRSIVLPRHVCMWLARKHTRFSLEEIGGYFGGRDHTTVIHAVDSIDQKCSLDTTVAHDVGTVEQQVLSRPGNHAATPTPTAQS